MKVYQINVVCGSGSTGKIVVDLAHTIKEYGGECRIAYGRGNAPQEIDAIKVSSKLDLYVHAMLTRFTDKHGLYSKGATKRLIKDIQEYEPDIIHLHNIHGYYVNYEMLFEFLTKVNKPIVWTLHDCWTFTGHCAHFDYVKCNKWKRKCYKCPQKRIYPKSVFWDNSSDNYIRKQRAFSMPKDLTIVVVSDWLKTVTQQGILKEHAIKRIYNGIDLNIMKPTENDFRIKYQLEDKKIVLGVASVWDERKGIDTFYALASHMPSNYKLVMIGLSEKQLKEKPESILGFGKISSVEELAKWYTAADIYVNASVEETMGLTTVEAMACGTPVIVMNTTGSPELVTEMCGRTIEPKNIEQLKRAILDMENEKNMTESCICHAKNFEKNKQYKKYIELYRKIMLKV